MKRVRMISRLAGPAGNCEPGCEIELADDMADTLIAARAAEPVSRPPVQAPAIETAEAPARETPEGETQPKRTKKTAKQVLEERRAAAAGE